MLQLSQRPLTASTLDASMFVGRHVELDTIVRAVGLGFNVYVHGPAGIGKTSLLRQVQRILGDDAHVMTINGAGSVDEFTTALANAGDVADSGDLVAVLDRLAQSDTAPELICVDDVSVVWEVFGRHRDELWQFPFRWIVTGSSSTLAPPAATFFETTVALGPFPAEEIRELLERRIAQAGDDPQVELLESIAARLPDELRSATPRQVLSAVQSLMVATDPDAGARRPLATSECTWRVVSDDEQVLDVLEVYGPVHAGDELLLDQTGVSRSRVVQILKDLEQSGLATAQRAGKRMLYDATPWHSPEGGQR